MLRRGQTLIIFTFMLLFLSLMVLLTVSFGMRVRERMELQTLADAAAYSNAVATARTFNTVAIAHRTAWALTVARSATQAYISWTSIYRDALAALQQDASIFIAAYIAGVCPIPQKIPAGIAFGLWKQKLSQEAQRIQGVWDGVDKAASAQVREYNITTATFLESDFKANSDMLAGLLQGQNIAKKVIAQAGGSPWPITAPDAADMVATREAASDCNQGAWCNGLVGGTSIHQYEIYMGTRDDSFTTGRGGGTMLMTSKLMQLVQGYGTIAYLGGEGASARSDQLQGPVHGAEANWGAATSDDHGNLFYLGRFGGCPIPVPPLSLSADVLANLESNPDKHEWSRGTCPNASDTQTHSGIGDIAGGNWPITYDYTEAKVKDQADAYGQPKLYALLQRDYGGGSGQLDKSVFLDFDFAFVPGSPKHFSNRGTRSEGKQLGSNLRATGGASIDISKQTALATGMAYYHRGDDWKEPPNLMNPYWRATLVSPDIDQQGKMPGGDITQTLQQAGAQWAGDAATALYNAGFRGFQ